MKITAHRVEATHATRIVIELTEAELVADPVLAVPADAAPRAILLALYLHAIRREGAELEDRTYATVTLDEAWPNHPGWLDDADVPVCHLP